MASKLTRFDPFNDVARLSPFRRIEDLMREFSLTPVLRGFEPERQIRVDVTETDQGYLVKADMPGLKKDDIRISVEGNVVAISATIQEEKQETAGCSVYSERYSGELYRSFSLPQEVDDAKTEAKYQDGVLSLTLPKKPGTARKQITIQ
jgi:HSP20 family protein